ncbi:MAG: hypothetical protein D6780_02775 [Candidatus Dadabacteria bacterium]|nr:MAG: hypothetical protein D6780_02775 [Candidatus Dadabacteria bacterium]
MRKGKMLFCFIVSCFFLVLFAVPTQARADISQDEFLKMLDKAMKTDKGKEIVGTAMEQYFREKQRRAAAERQKQQQKQLEEQFKHPVEVAIGNSPVRGPKNAPITIVEFSDFQCPFCKRAFGTMEQILKNYKGKVKLVYKHFPLSFHQHADSAARAAVAAQWQGKFWEFHDALFKNQSKLGEDFYIQTAKKLGLDVEKFKRDMNSEKAKQVVKADLEQGRKLGISGTPGFFVNGVAVKGAYPYDYFKMIIDRWLKKLNK